VRARDARAAELDRAGEDVVGQRADVELRRRVEPASRGGHGGRLHPVRADDGAAVALDDDQVVAEGIVRVLVAAGGQRLAEALAELGVEHGEAQPERRVQLGRRAREAGDVATLRDLDVRRCVGDRPGRPARQRVRFLAHAPASVTRSTRAGSA
jgi:hypothetical protein